jgi:hypothetical protein
VNVDCELSAYLVLREADCMTLEAVDRNRVCLNFFIRHTRIRRGVLERLEALHKLNQVERFMK